MRRRGSCEMRRQRWAIGYLGCEIALTRAGCPSEFGQRVERAIAPAQRWIVRRDIPRHAAAQELQRARTDAGQAVELELDEDRIRRGLSRGGQPLADDAQDPAVA